MTANPDHYRARFAQMASPRTKPRPGAGKAKTQAT